MNKYISFLIPVFLVTGLLSCTLNKDTNDEFEIDQVLKSRTKVMETTETWELSGKVTLPSSYQYYPVLAKNSLTGTGFFQVQEFDVTSDYLISNSVFMGCGYPEPEESAYPATINFNSVFEILCRTMSISLKHDISINSNWENKMHYQFSSDVYHLIKFSNTITNVEQVTIGNTIYDSCLKKQVSITISKETETQIVTLHPDYSFFFGTINIWFKEGVGIVKVQYIHGNGYETVIELVSYDILGSDIQNYFPLHAGNTWTYKWKLYEIEYLN